MDARQKAELVRLMACELERNIVIRENRRETAGGSLKRRQESGTGKYQILADVRRLRRELMEVYRMVEGEW